MSKNWKYHKNELHIEVSKHFVPGLATILEKHGNVDAATNIKHSVKLYGADTVTQHIDNWDVKLVRDVIVLLEGAVGHPIPHLAVSTLKGLGRILQDPEKAKIKNLLLLPRLLADYLVLDAIDGWLYETSVDGAMVAWAVRSIIFEPADRHSPAYVNLVMVAVKASYEKDHENRNRNSKHEAVKTLTFHQSDIAGATVADLLLKRDVFKETPELKAEYDAIYEKFALMRPKEGKQFVVKHGLALAADIDYWERTESQWPLVNTKLINDEALLKRKIDLGMDNTFWEEYDTEAFKTRPVHPFILFFDLQKHELCWVHVRHIEEYVYDPSLRDKLVLPDKHRSLIDVLTADLDVFVDDIIEGKSGGTAILCYGAPGLGKTLTAEVYSEVVQRPLYRIHAGQLGTDLETVEAMLEECLKRAERWGAVMLIDEADVYIRKRSNDMQHNAVVAAFLRTLEYFNGLLFMTTNRVSDVDDAIASRMVAMFKYEVPDAEQATKIWEILSTQFECKLMVPVAELVKEFPDASGRDIKQLLKLTMKYAKQKKVKMNMSAFKTCAMFRGIV